jgi:diketogulonate reductase-like aldo/keto reductase
MGRFQGIPTVIYGTAFKFDNTAVLVEAALKAGFRGIDTSGSLSAYREKLVGDGLRKVLADETLNIKREDLYVRGLIAYGVTKLC